MDVEDGNGQKCANDIKRMLLHINLRHSFLDVCVYFHLFLRSL